MLIDEIEITGSSLTIRCVEMPHENTSDLFEVIMQRGDAFELETELPGFHDCDCDKNIIRGFYSTVVPFEVEHLIEGVTTKTLFKRLETCEFIISEQMLFIYGKINAGKLLTAALSALTGISVQLVEFPFEQMNQLQERLSKIKSIVVTNPKEKEIRRARLAGHMESYTEYNVIDPRNHNIESVSGMVFSPLGPITLTVSTKGTIRVGVKKGFILNLECLKWILGLIRDEKQLQ